MAANGVGGIEVGASGQALDAASAEPPSSEGIGVTIALIILLFAFGSLVGAFLPIGTAVLSLAAVGLALIAWSRGPVLAVYALIVLVGFWFVTWTPSRDFRKSNTVFATCSTRA